MVNIRFLIACLALGLLAAGGCAPGPKVHTDFDPSAEFSAFRTYAFSGMTDRSGPIPLNSSPRFLSGVSADAHAASLPVGSITA